MLVLMLIVVFGSLYSVLFVMLRLVFIVLWLLMMLICVYRLVCFDRL